MRIVKEGDKYRPRRIGERFILFVDGKLVPVEFRSGICNKCALYAEHSHITLGEALCSAWVRCVLDPMEETCYACVPIEEDIE